MINVEQLVSDRVIQRLGQLETQNCRLLVQVEVLDAENQKLKAALGVNRVAKVLGVQSPKPITALPVIRSTNGQTAKSNGAPVA